MYWTALIIETGAAHTEALSNLLIELGALSVDIHDAATGTQHEQSLFEQSNNLPKMFRIKYKLLHLYRTRQRRARFK